KPIRFPARAFQKVTGRRILGVLLGAFVGAIVGAQLCRMMNAITTPAHRDDVTGLGGAFDIIGVIFMAIVGAIAGALGSLRCNASRAALTGLVAGVLINAVIGSNALLRAVYGVDWQFLFFSLVFLMIGGVAGGIGGVIGGFVAGYGKVPP